MKDLITGTTWLMNLILIVMMLIIFVKLDLNDQYFSNRDYILSTSDRTSTTINGEIFKIVKSQDGCEYLRQEEYPFQYIHRPICNNPKHKVSELELSGIMNSIKKESNDE
jgi:hypothetical protein